MILIVDRFNGSPVASEKLLSLNHNRKTLSTGPRSKKMAMIVKSAAMRDVLKHTKRVAPTDSTVLILGETGTGKDLLAKYIHQESRRRDGSFVSVNCAALPSSLIESELFGHERGAFTGATATREGHFEMADGGTIFLDEVGELPLDLQTKLLRVLQDGEYYRVGGKERRYVDARVITATNRDLRQLVEEGKFREDLYFRVNVFPMRLPPLRNRVGDIQALAEHFVAKNQERVGNRVVRIPPETIETLRRHTWPGNIRELENVIERAMILSDGPELELTESILGTMGSPESNGPVEQAPSVEGEGRLQKQEKTAIQKALQECNGLIEGRRGAAVLLGIAPSTLRDRMRRYELNRMGDPR